MSFFKNPTCKSVLYYYLWVCKVRFLYDYWNTNESNSTKKCFKTTKMGVSCPLNVGNQITTDYCSSVIPQTLPKSSGFNRCWLFWFSNSWSVNIVDFQEEIDSHWYRSDTYLYQTWQNDASRYVTIYLILIRFDFSSWKSWFLNKKFFDIIID